MYSAQNNENFPHLHPWKRLQQFLECIFFLCPHKFCFDHSSVHFLAMLVDLFSEVLRSFDDISQTIVGKLCLSVHGLAVRLNKIIVSAKEVAFELPKANISLLTSNYIWIKSSPNIKIWQIDHCIFKSRESSLTWFKTPSLIWDL